MADFSALIQRIKDAVYENGVQAITGQILQDCLKDVVNTVNVAKQDGIYRVTVTVDNNTGVPSATARMDDDTYTLEFSFHNLKGETGPQGPQGDTPVLTADSDGVIYSDGVMLTRVIKDTTDALTTRADSDHARAESDHARAESDHARAASDHTQAASDHTASETATQAATDAAEQATEAAETIDAKIAGKADESEVSQLRSEVNGQPLSITYPGRIDIDGTITNVAGSVYRVFKVSPGSTLQYSASTNRGFYFYPVKSFSFNPTLPYTLDLATGITSRKIATTANVIYYHVLPSDAEYIVCSGVPTNLILDGRSMFDSLETNLVTDAQKIMRFATGTDVELRQDLTGASGKEYYGELTTTSPASMLYSSTRRYIVIKVSGGSVLKYKRITSEYTYFYIVKSFSIKDKYEQFLLDLATGETGQHNISTANYEYYLTCPADAQYVLLQSYIGTSSRIPEEFLVDGKDAINGIIPIVSGLESSVTDINKRNRINIWKDGAFTFYVRSYNKDGKALTFKFIRYEKKWDTISYIDGDGNTQTKTDFYSARVWGNNEVGMGSPSTYILQGNSNFVIQAYGDNFHAGDAHGNEVMKYCKFFADGKEFDPMSLVSLTEVLEKKSFRFMWRSEIYSPDPASGSNSYTGAYPRFDTEGNPIVNCEHWIDGTINTEGGVNIDNRLIIRQDGLKFNSANGAMLESNYGSFTTITMDDNESSILDVANDGTTTFVEGIDLKQNPNQFADKVSFYGGNFFAEQESVVVSELKHPNIHLEFYNNRLKAYLKPVNCANFPVGDETPDTFNSGDVIRVLATRKIYI